MPRGNDIPQRDEENRYAERFRVADFIASRFGLKRRFPHRRGMVRKAQDLVILPGLEGYYASRPRSARGELHRRRKRAEYPPSEFPAVGMNWDRFAEAVQPQ